MKPNFALKLSNDGVEFLHRAAGGWVPVGTLSFESEDVAKGCAALIAKARELEPAGIRTKLVLPDSEIRYENVIAPGPTDEARRYQIEAEIERLTPYSIDELAYDWAVEEDSALVVICARETLTEAETFAEGYGFNPVSFVALPAAGQFMGEPFLGETSVARAYLPKGEKVQRDAEAVRVVSAPRAEPAKPAPASPKAEPEASAQPVAAPVQKAASTPVVPPVTPPVSAPARPAEVAAPTAPAPRPAPSASVAPSSGAPAADKAPMPGIQDARAKVGDLVRRMGTRLRREQASETPKPQTSAQQPPVAAPRAPIAARPGAQPVTRPVTPPPASAGSAARADATRTTDGKDTPAKDPAAKAPLPPARSTPADNAKPPIAPVSGGNRPASASETDSTAAIAARPAPGTQDVAPGGPAFASRRRPAPSLAASGPGPAKPAGDAPGGRIAVTQGQTGARTAVDALSSRLSGGVQGVMARLGQRKEGDTPRPRRAAPVTDAIVPASRPPVNEQDKVREAEALTIFGARGMQRPQASLAGRGLMIAGAALLLLVAVAVWALYFTGEPTPTQLADGGDTVLASDPPTDQATDQTTGAITAPAEVATDTAALTDNGSQDNAQIASDAVSDTGSD
ncbi:MAG: hypothetical protein KDJ96_02660, partial [Rhodobacteraceae bacterium]|nr:hypothetical protein [Paracoccaceae bacterium]